MDRKIVHLIICLLTYISITGTAQEIWTLERCIEYGIEHNLDIESERISRLQTINEHTRSKLEFLPTIHSSTGVVLHPQRSINSTVEISAKLFDGMRRYYHTKSLGASSQIAEQEVERIRNDLSIAITKAFLEVLLAKEMVRISDMSYQVIDEQYTKQKVLYESGKSSYSSLLDIESQRSSERVKLYNYRNVLSSNHILLSHLINLPYSEDFGISDQISQEDIVPITWESIDTIFRKARSLPHIRASELKARQRMYEARMAAGSISPTLSMDIGYDLRYHLTNIGFRIEIPIFNGGYAVTNIKNASLEHKKSLLEVKRQEQELYKEIRKAVQDGISYYQEYMASLDHLRAAQTAFEFSREKLDVGVITTGDYNYSKNTLFEAHSRSLQAKYKYIFQLKILEFYKGEHYR